MTTREPTRLSGIYVVLDAAISPDLANLLDAALSGGARVVQYRAKGGVDRALAARLAAATQAVAGLFIVNDDLETAFALPGAGLHLGQEDLAAVDRDRLGAFAATRVLGVSCATPAEASAAVALGATYVGVGPFAATTTKADAGPAIGEDGVAAVVRAVPVPVVAIGGIDEPRIAAVVRSGAAMAAVVTAIARDPDPRRATARLVAAWNRCA